MVINFISISYQKIMLRYNSISLSDGGRWKKCSLMKLQDVKPTNIQQAAKEDL